MNMKRKPAVANLTLADIPYGGLFELASGGDAYLHASTSMYLTSAVGAGYGVRLEDGHVARFENNQAVRRVDGTFVEE